MKKISNILILTALLCVAGCDKSPKATIEGTITEAADKVLYLDYIGVGRTTTVDSVRLDEEGAFRFRVAQPECFDFYRLRVGREMVFVSVDSTETLTLTAALPSMATDYAIEGSEDNLMLKQLVHKQRELQQAVQLMMRNSNDPGTRIGDLVNDYKKAVRMEYIYPDPSKPYAYFALFQSLNGQLIFDPTATRDDIRCFAAVATSLDLFYPEATRTKNIKNITLKGLDNIRPEQPVDYSVLEGKITEASIIDIALPDIDGATRRLTDLKGKVVMLEFNVYDHPMSAIHVFILCELHSIYGPQGFEIYQVSLDENEHFWKTAVENVPWICVRPDEAPYSKEATLYGVRELPTYFLINRAGELVMRDEMVEDLEMEICRLLEE